MELLKTTLSSNIHLINDHLKLQFERKKNLMLLLQDSKNQRKKNVAYTLEAEEVNAFNLVFNVKNVGEGNK